jgi:outer membrane protein assembly factor BamB
MSGPQEGKRLWEFVFADVPPAGSVLHTPIVDRDGTIYVGSGTQGGGHVYAITPAGTLKWQSPRLEAAPGAPALGPDGTIYVGTVGLGHTLYALDPLTGTIKSALGMGDQVHAITVVQDGTLYVTSAGGFLYALDAALREQWRVHLIMAAAPPVVGRDGTIYVVAPGLQAYHPNGTLKWVASLGHGGIVIGPSGTVYIAGGVEHQEAVLTALTPDGTPLWGAALNTTVCGTLSHIFGASLPGIAPDGGLILGVMGAHLTGVTAGSGAIQAFNADGSTRWTFCPATVGDTIDTAPTIDRTGHVYFMTGVQGRPGPKTLYALRPDGSEQWRVLLGHVASEGIAIGPDRLYVTTLEQDGLKLVAVGADAAPVVPAPRRAQSAEQRVP